MQIKKIWNEIKTTIKEEYKFIIALFILYIILQFPLNYYIVTGGGISDISSRIDVAEKNPSKGSFNISYVIERKGTILTYGLSYLIPSWERESVDNYKYTEEDSIEDIEFRSDLDLKTANGQATYWAYTLAKKEVNLINENLYVILTFKEYETPLQVQDRIISMDGNSYHSLKEYKDYIQTKEKGSTIKVLVDRKGKELELDVPVYEEKGVSIIVRNNITPLTAQAKLSAWIRASVFGSISPKIRTITVTATVDNAVPAAPKSPMQTTVASDDVSIFTILLPIRIVVSVLSYPSIILSARSAFFDPFSALLFRRMRFAPVNAVSDAEKKADIITRTTRIIIIGIYSSASIFFVSES